MEIKKIGIVGQGALGVMYGNYLKKRMGNENVFFIADEGRVNRYRSADMVCNGEACGFSYRSPTEVDLFAGTMLKIAKKEGFSLPVNTFLYEKLKELEGASD